LRFPDHGVKTKAKEEGFLLVLDAPHPIILAQPFFPGQSFADMDDKRSSRLYFITPPIRDFPEL
jgi:hypothetical protein